jgi:16S rRNA G966 N2-methylase RsmD
MINLMHGDCLELMKTIPDKSIDMVLTDPPYGTTACKWDVVIPFEPSIVTGIMLTPHLLVLARLGVPT